MSICVVLYQILSGYIFSSAAAPSENQATSTYISVISDFSFPYSSISNVLKLVQKGHFMSWRDTFWIPQYCHTKNQVPLTYIFCMFQIYFRFSVNQNFRAIKPVCSQILDSVVLPYTIRSSCPTSYGYLSIRRIVCHQNY